MLEKYQDQISILVEWYARAKEVAIKAESLDSAGTGYIQPLHEQRYSLDHFMRAIEYDQADEEKTQKAINSAIAHLQRAYSDSIEWILVSVKDDYSKVLSDFTTSQIQDGFPEYYQTIRPAISEITDLVNEYKIKKSVEKVTTPSANFSDVDLTDKEMKETDQIAGKFLSMDVVTKLCEYRKMLDFHESALIEIRSRDKKSDFKDKILIPTITAIIAGLIVYFFTAA